jgi:hypothetical protein
VTQLRVREAGRDDLEAILHILSEKEFYPRGHRSAEFVRELCTELHCGLLGEHPCEDVITLVVLAEGSEKVLAYLTFLEAEVDENTGESISTIMDWGSLQELESLGYSLIDLVNGSRAGGCTVVEVAAQDHKSRKAFLANDYQIDRYDYYKLPGHPQTRLTLDNLTIRRAKPGDEEAIFELLVDGEEHLQPEGRNPSWERLDDKLANIEDGGLRRELTNPESAFFVAEFDIIIGFLWLQAERDDDTGFLEWSVHRFGMDDDYWDSETLPALEQQAYLEVGRRGLSAALPKIGEDPLLQHHFESQGYELQSVRLFKYHI